MSEPAVRVENLWRSFGELSAVRGVSFDIPAGRSVGFIGANGAGKTTTMRMLATLDLPDSGSISLCGEDALLHGHRLRCRVGWMPDYFGTYDYMTVRDYLDFFARAYRLRGAPRRSRIADLLEFTGLDDLEHRDIATLSKGQSQRVCLARTLLHDPEILILDEPAAGLDPQARVEFKRLVRLLAAQGKTIFISSHILSELEDMCDSLLFIDKGQIIHFGSAETLKRGGARGIFVDVRFEGELGLIEQWAAEQRGVRIAETIKGGARICIEDDAGADRAEILRRLVAAGIRVSDFHEHERKLEDAFIDLLSEKGEEERT